MSRPAALPAQLAVLAEFRQDWPGAVTAYQAAAAALQGVPLGRPNVSCQRHAEVSAVAEVVHFKAMMLLLHQQRYAEALQQLATHLAVFGRIPGGLGGWQLLTSPAACMVPHAAALACKVWAAEAGVPHVDLHASASTRLCQGDRRDLIFVTVISVPWACLHVRCIWVSACLQTASPCLLQPPTMAGCPGSTRLLLR